MKEPSVDFGKQYQKRAISVLREDSNVAEDFYKQSWLREIWKNEKGVSTSGIALQRIEEKTGPDLYNCTEGGPHYERMGFVIANTALEVHKMFAKALMGFNYLEGHQYQTDRMILYIAARIHLHHLEEQGKKFMERNPEKKRLSKGSTIKILRNFSLTTELRERMMHIVIPQNDTKGMPPDVLDTIRRLTITAPYLKAITKAASYNLQMKKEGEEEKEIMTKHLSTEMLLLFWTQCFGRELAYGYQKHRASRQPFKKIMAEIDKVVAGTDRVVKKVDRDMLNRMWNILNTKRALLNGNHIFWQSIEKVWARLTPRLSERMEEEMNVIVIKRRRTPRTGEY